MSLPFNTHITDMMVMRFFYSPTRMDNLTPGHNVPVYKKEGPMQLPDDLKNLPHDNPLLVAWCVLNLGRIPPNLPQTEIAGWIANCPMPGEQAKGRLVGETPPPAVPPMTRTTTSRAIPGRPINPNSRATISIDRADEVAVSGYRTDLMRATLSFNLDDVDFSNVRGFLETEAEDADFETEEYGEEETSTGDTLEIGEPNTLDAAEELYNSATFRDWVTAKGLDMPTLDQFLEGDWEYEVDDNE